MGTKFPTVYFLKEEDNVKIIDIDIETYSSVDLARCGVYKYSEAEDFETLLFATVPMQKSLR